MKTRLAVLVLAVTASLGAAVPAQADPSPDCETFVRAQVEAAGVDATDSLVASGCATHDAEVARLDMAEVPTLLMAWPAVGVTNDAGGVGFPVSGVCILSGAPISLSEAQYVLVGVANSVGPATSTRVACAAGPLSADATLIGPAAAAVDTQIAPLYSSMSVCTLAVGKFIDGSTTRSRTPAGCSLKPAVTLVGSP